MKSRPNDWPGPGEIDLACHDPPHESSSVEWWYLHAPVDLEGGREASLFAGLFRVRMGEQDAGREGRLHRHHILWALCDDEGMHRSFSRLDPATARDAARRLRAEGDTKDPHVLRAVLEILDRGAVPHPDRLARQPARVSCDRLAIDFEDDRLHAIEGGYSLSLRADDGQAACDLSFWPTKRPQRHGVDGIAAAFTVKSMFYYFQPRCRVEGSITLGGETFRVVRGEGWVDHEFGKHEEGSSGDQLDFGWTWVAAQLDDGSEVTAYETFERGKRDRSNERRVILVSPGGERETLEDFTLEPLAHWTSVSTFATYPVAFRLRVPSRDLDLTLTAKTKRQEVLTILSPPGFWEGRVRVEGTSGKKPVRGHGFVELTGLGHGDSLERFFSEVGRETRRQVDAFLPAALGSQDVVRLFASEANRPWVDGVDAERAAKNVTTPLREIALRGGKAWRSYALLACIEAVGGDPDRLRHWLTLPELMHSGSLILDDVADSSTIRRGGPACHVVHGHATAINVGGAAPYLALVVLLRDGLSMEERAMLYEHCHEGLRAAYLGQALDIAGLSALVPAVVESGDARALEEQVYVTHRLKSAAPPAMLARVAVRIARGSQAQQDALATLFGAYGLAFQIVDDVLNLRGFEGKLKTVGEDIVEGKVTAPVAKAFGLLDRDERGALSVALRDGSRDAAAVERAIRMVERCGALDACMADARAIVERAWAEAAPLLRDSNAKIMLRAFGYYVLERHY
jgi:geranylgeranyl pyrophosphate synthase/predicted secreted hydrolase